MHTTTRRRGRGLPEAHRAGAAVVLAGVLIVAASLSPTLDLALTVGLPMLAAVVLLARRVARVLRWHREDHADTLTAAAWRAAHTAAATPVDQPVGGRR